MQRTTRVIGLLVCGGTVGLWVVLSFFNPYGYQGATATSYIIAILMVLLTIIGIVAILMAKPYWVLIVALASFMPVGFYLLGTPGVFRWIGVFNVLLFVSGLLMLVGRKQ
jgi:hypothetical protein